MGRRLRQRVLRSLKIWGHTRAHTHTHAYLAKLRHVWDLRGHHRPSWHPLALAAGDHAEQRGEESSPHDDGKLLRSWPCLDERHSTVTRVRRKGVESPYGIRSRVPDPPQCRPAR